MGFVIGTVLAFMFLEPPWRYIVLVPLAVWEVFEILLWLKLRRVKSITGAETYVGAVGKAISDCRPEGQVRVKGQIWGARCDEGVDAGDRVVVEEVNGLRLRVRPA